jgi:ethanolaminephosphotransferase
MLDAAQRSGLKRYKYAGADMSLVYKYILSPLAQFGVDYLCPSWLAPNVITLGGLLCSVVAIIVVLTFNPYLNDDTGARWVHLFAAFMQFTYQTLDNMDGKQARKIGASSPLGLLFDHGCDSLNTGILLIPVASYVGGGWGLSMICVLTTTFAAFYFPTWEEYVCCSMFFLPFLVCDVSVTLDQLLPICIL